MFNLRLDDAVRQLANALILYLRALACEHGDGVMRDHRFHVGDVADGLLERIGTLVVEKTGTPHERQAEGRGGRAHHRLLGIRGAAARRQRRSASEHPLAEAIVNEAKARGIQTTEVQDFDSPVGKGALGTVEGKKVLLGNAAFMRSQGVDTSAMEAEAERQRGEGATVINMAVDGKLPGIVAIADPV